MLPQKIGRYEIKAELGRGGMATVYRAHDPRFKREVALKVLPREFLHDPQFRARFEREAETIASLEHPAIVPVYDYGEDDGQPYIVMRLMLGGSLAERLANQAVPVIEAARIFSRLAPALDRAHVKGIIHRDLKPGNILFDDDDNPYISDFGIAKLTQAAATFTGSAIVGTPAYMSPEQARGEKVIDGRSDIYALGIIVFQMLTGKFPYEADTPMGVLFKHVMDPVPNILAVRADLPEACAVLIQRAMAKSRDERFSTAGALAKMLTTIADGRALNLPHAETPAPYLAETVPVTLPPQAETPVPEALPTVVAQPKTSEKQALLEELAAHKEVAVGEPPVAIVAVALASSTPPQPLELEPVEVNAVLPASIPTPKPVVKPTEPRSGHKKPLWLWVGVAVVGALVLALGVWGWLISVTSSVVSVPTLFVSNRNGAAEIYRLTAEGVAQVTSTDTGRGSWTPVALTNGVLMFTSDRDGPREIYRLEPTGETVRVTNTLGGYESWGAVTDANGNLLFTSTRDGKRELYRLTTAGDVVRVTNTPGDGESWDAVMEASGSLVFTSDRAGKRELYRLSTAGGISRITNTTDGESWWPAIEPNGAILFTSTRDGQREIYRLTLTGEVARVTNTSYGESWASRVESSGAVLFTSTRDGKAELYRLTTAGEVVRVTNTAGGEAWTRLDDEE